MRLISVNPAVLDLLDARRVFDHPRAGLRRWAVGRRLLVAAEAAIEPYAHVFAGDVLPRRMGAFSYAHSPLAAHVAVGRYCSLGSNISWIGGGHPAEWATTSPFTYDPVPLPGFRAFFADSGGRHSHRTWWTGPAWEVDIGHDVWIGDEAAISPYARIGHGAVVGARALVTKDVPPYAIVGGVPARVIRYRFPEALVERLLASQWWRYTPDVLEQAPFHEPERFVDELPDIVARLEALDFRPVALSGDDLIRAAAASPPAQP